MCLLAPPVACGVQGALVVDRHRRRRDVRSEGPGGDAMLPAREAMGLMVWLEDLLAAAGPLADFAVGNEIQFKLVVEPLVLELGVAPAEGPHRGSWCRGMMMNRGGVVVGMSPGRCRRGRAPWKGETPVAGPRRWRPTALRWVGGEGSVSE